MNNSSNENNGSDGTNDGGLPPDLQPEEGMADKVDGAREALPDDLTPEQEMISRLGVGSDQERLVAVEGALKHLLTELS